MEKTIKCAECGENDVPPYRKKYCDDCAKAKKAAFEANELPAASQVEKIMHEDKPSRETSIVAQCLTKVVYQENATYKPEDVLKTYNYFLKEL